jgi:hypothetical protein
MLAFADYANEDGRSAYPSKNTIANRTGLSLRGVFKCCRILVEKGFLIVEEANLGRRVHYALNVQRLAEQPPRTGDEKLVKAPSDPCTGFTRERGSPLNVVQGGNERGAGVGMNVVQGGDERGSGYPLINHYDKPPINHQLIPEVKNEDKCLLNRKIEKLPARVAPGVVLPKALDTPRFRELWAAWHAVCLNSGISMAIPTAEFNLAKLAGLNLDQAVFVLESAISAGWRKLVFEVADKRPDKHSTQQMRDITDQLLDEMAQNIEKSQC